MDINIHRFENESNYIYNYRKDFILNNLTTFEDNNTLIRYSKILANIKFKGCKYNPIIYNKLKAYL
jgi:hypothetical protein